MKRNSCLLLVLLLVAVWTALPVRAAEGPKVVSDAAVLMDADTGEILWSKKKNAKMYPASITKVLTGLLVAENCDMKETAVANASALKIPKGYAHIALQSGDRITVNNAMYAMMLPSANDAAHVLAEHVSGSQKQFASLMNARAKELGATRSSFKNASGVPGKKHYTTAYDMALITQAAIGNKTFAKYFGATKYTLPAVNSVTREVELKNYQYMLLEEEKEYYPDVTGGKIGYTPQAGHTMCTAARRGGKTLICVVMGSTRDGKYQDTAALLDYGFG